MEYFGRTAAFSATCEPQCPARDANHLQSIALLNSTNVNPCFSDQPGRREGFQLKLPLTEMVRVRRSRLLPGNAIREGVAR